MNLVIPVLLLGFFALSMILGCTPQQQPKGYQDGVLRLVRLKHVSFEDYRDAPYQGLAPKYFESVVEQFAERNQLEVKWVLVETESDLITTLQNDHADIAVGLLPKDLELGETLEYSRTLSSFEDWVVGREIGNSFVAVAGSRHESQIRSLYPNARLTLYPPGSAHDELADAIVRGEIRATIMAKPIALCFVESDQSNPANTCDLSYTPKLRHLHTLSANHFGWIFRKDRPELILKLNAHLDEALLFNPAQRQQRTWAEIQNVGTLRMITRDGPTTYFLWKGERAGFEYEILRLFASDHDLELDVVIGNRLKQLEDWLVEGQGDLISASYSNLNMRVTDGLAFSNPYISTQEQVVSSNPPIRDLEDLAGRTLILNPETSNFRVLSALRGSYDFEIEERPFTDTEALIDEAIIAPNLVTIADRNLVATVAAKDSRLAAGVVLGAQQNLVWVLRDNQPELLKQLNEWLERKSGSFEFNLIRAKYFQNIRTMTTHGKHRISEKQLSEFDDIVKQVASEFDFDWRLITAMMYQESQFNPNAISFKDARGLMQVLPSTALEFGTEASDLLDPEINIRTGVEYLAWLRDRFSEAKPGERMWFTLAAFNAGIGHVRDARRIARTLGDDPDQWFNHVENAILKLSDPSYYSHATYGYCRGEEPFKYVREIKDRYQAYVDHFANRDIEINGLTENLAATPLEG